MEIVERIKNLCNTENITIKELERIIQFHPSVYRGFPDKNNSLSQ